MSSELAFKPSDPYTLGVELELQIVNTDNYNLTTDAESLLRRLFRLQFPGEVKPEITQSMIEVNSSVHTNCGDLLNELMAVRTVLVKEALSLNVRICGGGSHPFQTWSDRRIFPSERFQMLVGKYGYLAKQFTVFGQHIHVGCRNGDDALYLAHALGRYVPHFVALSAASPYFQGQDTDFDSCRLSVVNAFPLAGVVPLVHRWADFEAYYDKMVTLGVVESMKDFYWDIRPKPEYGTVEIRVCDTPLTVERATQLASYAQALAAYLLESRPFAINENHYLVYNMNKFQACRHGFRGQFIDPANGERRELGEDITRTLREVEPYALKFDPSPPMLELVTEVKTGQNDARWLRTEHDKVKSLAHVVRRQAELWMKVDEANAAAKKEDKGTGEVVVGKSKS
jgi:glutamate---cysteine ligase / carboxylate-amine ligase